MSVNKLALIRYKTIDNCLRNKYKKWTLENLIEKVSTVLYEQEGITNGISKRTIQADIQLMRSDKLGYNAPIIVKDKKYYSYEDNNYSITNTPINNADVDKMKEIVDLLKQFNGFNYFQDMSDMIARLENNLYQSTHHNQSCIQFENNHLLRGLEHISPLHQAILHKIPLLIHYQSFKAIQPHPNTYYPYLLKEYRNRWFLIARPHNTETIVTLALDRIISIDELPKKKFINYNGPDFETYYNDLIGVTKSMKDSPRKVILQFNKENTPYITTKPLHHSQKLLKQDETGCIICINVVLNFELEREILGFGDAVKVLAPKQLLSRIKRRIEKAGQQYA